jgi:hypothetical protein
LHRGFTDKSTPKKPEGRWRHTVLKKQCSNCYWWDAAPAAAGEPFHECHNTDKRAAVKASMNWHTFATQPHQRCTYFRAISPNDPATLWNRRHPGHKERKPKDPEAVKRGKASKRKGARREKELGDKVTKDIGGEAIVRHGNRDVQFLNNGLENHHIEVKGFKAFAFTKHCHQAEQDAATHGLPRWLVAC